MLVLLHSEADLYSFLHELDIDGSLVDYQQLLQVFVLFLCLFHSVTWLGVVPGDIPPFKLEFLL